MSYRLNFFFFFFFANDAGILCGIIEYLMKSYDVDNPGTQSGCSRGLNTHKLWVEVWVTQILIPQHSHHSVGNVLFIKVNQCLQEIIYL